MIMTNKITQAEKKQIQNHANRNIAYLLDKLGATYTDRGDGLIQAVCPCSQHGGDRNNDTAWTWRTDLGKWVCWSHHCEEDRGNDIFGLVSSILSKNFRETVDWVVERLGEKQVNISCAVPEPEFASRGSSLHIHEPLNEDNLVHLKRDPQYLLDRGFDRDVLRSYGAGLWDKPYTYMTDRVVFPVRDHDGKLVGYSGRTIYPESFFAEKSIKYAKWLHGRHYHRRPQRGEFFTSSILFNLDRAKRYLSHSSRLILVEGPLDGMRLEEAGIHNWVATLGTNFCAPHRTLLVNFGVTDLYVAYDNDPPKGPKQRKAGDDGWKRIERVVGSLINLHRIILPPNKDCGDLSVEELQTLFEGTLC
jgi:hypothetical protein